MFPSDGVTYLYSLRDFVARGPRAPMAESLAVVNDRNHDA